MLVDSIYPGQYTGVLGPTRTTGSCDDGVCFLDRHGCDHHHGRADPEGSDTEPLWRGDRHEYGHVPVRGSR